MLEAAFFTFLAPRGRRHATFFGVVLCPPLHAIACKIFRRRVVACLRFLTMSALGAFR